MSALLPDTGASLTPQEQLEKLLEVLKGSVGQPLHTGCGYPQSTHLTHLPTHLPTAYLPTDPTHVLPTDPTRCLPATDAWWTPCGSGCRCCSSSRFCARRWTTPTPTRGWRARATAAEILLHLALFLSLLLCRLLRSAGACGAACFSAVRLSPLLTFSPPASCPSVSADQSEDQQEVLARLIRVAASKARLRVRSAMRAQGEREERADTKRNTLCSLLRH